MVSLVPGLYRPAYLLGKGDPQPRMALGTKPVYVKRMRHDAEGEYLEKRLGRYLSCLSAFTNCEEKFIIPVDFIWIKLQRNRIF